MKCARLQRVFVVLCLLGVGFRGDFDPPAAQATPISLSGPMLAGDVGRFAIAPDGQTVIFTSDERMDNFYELYRVSIWGGTPVRLSAPLTVTKRLHNFVVTADARWIIYSVEHPQNAADPYAQREIYRHPIDDSSASVRLSHSLTSNADIPPGGFSVSRDGRYVLYRVCQSGCEIFSVAVAGSPAPIKLNKTLPSGGTIWLFQSSPDSRWVAYLGEQDANDKDELYSVPINGPASAGRKLSIPLAPNEDVFASFQIDAASQRVLYYAPQAGTSAFNLFSVPISGTGPSVPLLPPPGVGLVSAPASATAASAQVTPNGLLVYEEDDAVNGSLLYGVPISGPAEARVQLSAPIAPGYSIEYLNGIWPNSQHYIFTACVDCSSVNVDYKIYAAPVTGGSPTSLLLAEHLNVIGGGLVTHDGQNFLYSDGSQSYSVPLYGLDQTATVIAPVSGQIFGNPGGCQLIILTTERDFNHWPYGESYTDTVQTIGPIGFDIPPYQLSFAFGWLGSRLVYLADNGSGHLELFAEDMPSCFTEKTYLPLVRR